jgi:hypothetical protein
MSKKIEKPEHSNTLDENDVIDMLVKSVDDEEGNKTVLLFQNTREKSEFSNEVGKALRNNPLFSIDRSKALTIRNNVLRSHKTKIYLGLKVDEDLLTNDYDKDQIKYYAKRID